MRAGKQLTALIVFVIACGTGLAAEAQTPYEESIQYALERLTSGISANSQVGEAEITIKPIRTWKSVTGHYCRQYELTVAKPDSTPDQEEGVRCRDSDGVWKQAK
jgi:surface antigen